MCCYSRRRRRHTNEEQETEGSRRGSVCADDRLGHKRSKRERHRRHMRCQGLRRGIPRRAPCGQLRDSAPEREARHGSCRFAGGQLYREKRRRCSRLKRRRSVHRRKDNIRRARPAQKRGQQRHSNLRRDRRPDRLRQDNPLGGRLG